jgi:hypothetical protein
VTTTSGDREEGAEQGISAQAVEQARGVLVLALRASPDAAGEKLGCVSRRHEVSVETIARAIVSAASGVEVNDPLLRKILWEEWGDLLL